MVARYAVEMLLYSCKGRRAWMILPTELVLVVACNDASDAGAADGFAEDEGWAVGGFVRADEEAPHVGIERREEVLRCEAVFLGSFAVQGPVFDY